MLSNTGIMDKSNKEYKRNYFKRWKENNIDRVNQYRLKSRDKDKERCKRWRDINKINVINHYGGKCKCCGETRIEFLTIDHIFGNGNKHRKKVGGGSVFYRWLIKNNLPVGYRVLCYNCNCAIGYFGYCPHGNISKENLETKELNALPLFS